jgi:hypothetical protein
MTAAVFVGVLALPMAAGADEIFLRSGGRLSGLIVERRADGIVVDVGPGRVTLPSRLVERVVESTPVFEIFRERSARLSETELKGWLDLALWARDRDLLTQSRQAFEHVLAIDPGHALANRELGRVMVDGRWMTADEGYRARGYVNFEGRWVTADERLAIVSERAAEAQARQAEVEASARAREAEARARTAEAEARRAEAEAYAPAEGVPLGLYGGLPYVPYGGVVIGSYGGYGSGRHRGSHGRGSGRGNDPSCGPTRPGGTTAPGPTTAPPSPPGTTANGSSTPAQSPPAQGPTRGSFRGYGPPAAQPAKSAY